jgi:hypothetical protein
MRATHLRLQQSSNGDLSSGLVPSPLDPILRLPVELTSVLNAALRLADSAGAGEVPGTLSADQTGAPRQPAEA